MFRPLVNMNPSIRPTEFIPILPCALCLCLMPALYTGSAGGYGAGIRADRIHSDHTSSLQLRRGYYEAD